MAPGNYGKSARPCSQGGSTCSDGQEIGQERRERKRQEEQRQTAEEIDLTLRKWAKRVNWVQAAHMGATLTGLRRSHAADLGNVG